ncbi:hypothetical protein G6F57_020313 [Rhizopus arrhizus]|nr:hypothetical protein G6F57_020313 [Rhizopus arrhizus]
MASQQELLAHRYSNPDIGQEFMMMRKKSSPTNSYELRRSAAVNNVFDRLSSGHTQASQAKKKLTPSPNKNRYSSSSIDDLRRQWAIELEKIKNVC